MNKFSIGIVTFLGRFEVYFKHLIRKLYLLFPDYDIDVFLNGHYDIVKQVQYLRDVTDFLRKYPNIRYVTNVDHRSIARGWNWLILMSRFDRVLILNDDITIKLAFRHNLENLTHFPDFFIINRSWSHFVISKGIIKTVGWFDERFVGMGCEDHDYSFRLAMKGIPIETIDIHGISNQSAPQEDSGWADISDIDKIFGRHSQVNRDFLKQKWFWSDYGPVPEEGSFKIWYPAYDMEWIVAPNKGLEEMPEFYPLSSLDNSGGQKESNKYSLLRFLSITCSYINSIYWRARLRLGIGAWLRQILGPRWERWRTKISR